MFWHSFIHFGLKIDVFPKEMCQKCIRGDLVLYSLYWFCSEKLFYTPFTVYLDINQLILVLWKKRSYQFDSKAFFFRVRSEVCGHRLTLTPVTLQGSTFAISELHYAYVERSEALANCHLNTRFFSLSNIMRRFRPQDFCTLDLLNHPF